MEGISGIAGFGIGGTPFLGPLPALDFCLAEAFELEVLLIFCSDLLFYFTSFVSHFMVF